MPRNPFAPVVRGSRKHSAAATAAMSAVSPIGVAHDKQFTSPPYYNDCCNKPARKTSGSSSNHIELSGRGKGARTPSTAADTSGSLSPAMMGGMWNSDEDRQIHDMPSLISSSSSLSTGAQHRYNTHDFTSPQASFGNYVDEDDDEEEYDFGFGAQPQQTPLVKDDEVFFSDFPKPRTNLRHPASAFHYRKTYLASPTMQVRSSHYISDDDDDDDDDVFNIGGLNNTTTVDDTQDGAIEVVDLAPPSSSGMFSMRYTSPSPSTDDQQSPQLSERRGSLKGSLKGLSIRVDTDDDEEMIDTDDSGSSYTLNKTSIRQERILERILAQRAGDGSDASMSQASRSQNSRRPIETPPASSSSTIHTEQQQEPEQGFSTRVLVDGAATALSTGAVVESLHSPSPPPSTPPATTGLRRLAPRLNLTVGRRRSANQWNRLPSLGGGDSIGGQDVAAAVAVPTPGRRRDGNAVTSTPRTATSNSSPQSRSRGGTSASNGAQVATTGTGPSAMNVLTPRRLESRLQEAATLEGTGPTNSQSRHSSAPLLQVRKMTFVTPKRATSETAAGKVNTNGKKQALAGTKNQDVDESGKPVARESSDRTMSTNSTNPVRAKRRRKSVMDLARAESERRYWKKRLAETVVTFGSVHVRTAEHLLHLGNAHVRCKEYNEALGVFKSSVRILRQIHGDNHLSVAHALDRVGFAASRCGRRYSASRGGMVGFLSPSGSPSSSPVQPPRKSSRVAVGTPSLMDTSMDTTSSGNTEDTDHSPIGDDDNSDNKLADWALAALSEAFNIRYAQLGPTHCDVVDTLNNIAGIHLHRGELVEARDGYGEVLTVRSAIFGPSHPSVAVTAHALGGVYMRMSDLDEALRYYNVALRIYRADQMKLKDTHPMVTRVMRDIASTERIMVSMGYR